MSATAAVDPGAVTAPVSGTLQGWKVADGDEVAAGTVIAMMEAMKMEMQVLAPCAGRIVQSAEAGAYLAAGATIARIG